MQIFIGINLGYQAIIQWRDVLYPQWYLPMIDGFRALFGGAGSPYGALWALVGGIGILFYLQLSRKYASLSKIAIGITIGIGAGLTFKSQLGRNIPQILDAFKPLAPPIVRPQPRTTLKLPGSAFEPLVDDSLAIFVSGNTIEADEVLGGVRVWQTKLPSAVTGPPRFVAEKIMVPCLTEVVQVDRSTGKINPITFTGELLGNREGDPLKVVAVYRQPQLGHGVELRAKGSELSAYAIKDGVAEGAHAGDFLWSATYPEPIVSVQSFDGIAMITGPKVSEIWEIPPPQPKLTARDYFDNWVSVITIFCVMTYFFFSFKRRGPMVAAVSSSGRWVLMIGLGAFFGNTVMTRMSFLLDRLMFLIDDWLRPLWHQIFR